MRLARQPLIAANAARAAQRLQQRHRESGRIVLVVRGEPGDRRTLFQPTLPPLQQQRRLAEAGGRDDEDGGAIVDVVPEPLEPLALHRRARHARRCGLEGEFGFEHRHGPGEPQA